ncbi:REP-associated tyrosine transposase [Legionella feeleii]|uniref:Transposase and inactivated derivatives n=1 Tax=Legionella feeleii TaxID=453 RepID=A0A0W0TMD7_9GAMM|nr:hypothetical protein Lfee_1646 [Legionella feeleii]SPX60594.1 Transposase and inactivated derivatives [Legionella feeleii]
MVNYRRDKTPGGTYFFTLALRDRKSNWLTSYIISLGYSFRRARENNPFLIKAIVVLPEHLHMIMELPGGDADYSTRLRQIKTYFLQEILSAGEPLLKNQRNEYNLWQRRFWEHRIRDESDFYAHVNYIHFNPVKHGLVKEVIDWPHSSFHRYVREGLLPKNWSRELTGCDFGE